MKTTSPLDLIDTLDPNGPELREINEVTSAFVSCMKKPVTALLAVGGTDEIKRPLGAKNNGTR